MQVTLPEQLERSDGRIFTSGSHSLIKLSRALNFAVRASLRPRATGRYGTCTPSVAKLVAPSHILSLSHVCSSHSTQYSAKLNRIAAVCARVASRSAPTLTRRGGAARGADGAIARLPSHLYAWRGVGAR